MSKATTTCKRKKHVLPTFRRHVYKLKFQKMTKCEVFWHMDVKNAGLCNFCYHVYGWYRPSKMGCIILIILLLIYYITRNHPKLPQLCFHMGLHHLYVMASILFQSDRRGTYRISPMITRVSCIFCFEVS